MEGALELWHASYTVSNLERSIEFYRLLGFEVVHMQEQANPYTAHLVGYPKAQLRVAMLKPVGPVGVSGHVLELVEYVEPKGEPLPSEPCRPLAAHLAFVVRDLPEVCRRLQAAGIRFRSTGEVPVFIGEGRNRGGYTCYVYDPDGFIVELVQPPEHFWARQAKGLGFHEDPGAGREVLHRSGP